MVIGTVKGDIHDIGKNLVGDDDGGCGVRGDRPRHQHAVDKYLEALEEHKPDILGMSALLTTTMPYMKVVIDTMKEKGIRDDYVVLVGGAPLNEEFAQGGRRRRLLPRCRGRGRDRQGLCRRAATTARRALEPPEPDGRAPARMLVSPAARWRARSPAAIDANGWTHARHHLPPGLLHNRPERIAEAVRAADPRASRAATPHPRALRRLRHAAATLDGVLARGGRRADRGRALLRVLCRAGRYSRRWPMPSRARSTSPTSWPAAVRHAGDRGAGHRSASGAAADVLRQLPPPGLSWPGAEDAESAAAGQGGGRAPRPRIHFQLHGLRRAGRSLADFRPAAARACTWPA